MADGKDTVTLDQNANKPIKVVQPPKPTMEPYIPKDK